MQDSSTNEPDENPETLFPEKVIGLQALMNELLTTFARNVALQMTHQHLSTVMLAERAGIAPKTLNNILNNRHAPQLDVLAKLAIALNVEFWLLWLPDMPLDAADSKQVHSLLRAVAKLTPASLKMVARLARSEAENPESD